MSFYDDVTEPEIDEVTIMPTDATTLPEAPPRTLDAAEQTPKENWLVLIAPDGKITVAPMPPADTAPEEFLAFHRQTFRDIPPVTPKGVLCMSRGNGAGSLQLHVYEGAAPSREQLVKLRPLVLSRWSARIHTYGETRFEEDFPGLFGLKGEPAIMRTGPEIGPELAASCTGKPINHGWRNDGLRTGGGDLASLAGFIESAECDDHGVVATLLVLSPSLHWDLEDLDRHKQLDSARLCLSHSASGVPRQTAWNLKVFDLIHASANRLDFTSLAHSPGTRVLRRLRLDEPLSAADFQATERLYVPRELAVWTPSTVTVASWPPAPGPRAVPFDVTATIDPGAVTDNSPYINDTPQIVGTTAEVIAAQIDVTGVVAGARVDVQVFYFTNPVSGTSTIRLRKGTTTGGELRDAFTHGTAETGQLLASDTTPGIGTQSYVVTIQATNVLGVISRVRAMRFLAKR